MKKTISILGLILGLLPLNTLWSQIGSYNTVVSPLNTTIDSSGYDGQITIGFYPDMAISYHESYMYGGTTGVITVNYEAQTANRYIINHLGVSTNIYIRDMEQCGFSDTVFFCGKLKENSGDSTGIFGFFTVMPNGTLNNFTYYKISETDVLTRIVSYNNSTGSRQIAAIGKKDSSYFMVNNVPAVYAVYAVNPLNHPSIPADIICTDDYVAIVSYKDSHDRLYLRKFLKNDLFDNIRDNVYEFKLGDNLIFEPKAAFLGCKFREDSENDVGVEYISHHEGDWLAGLRVIDLSTMTMTHAQEADLAEKNDLRGITFLADSRKLASLFFLEPNYAFYNSAVALLEPYNNSGLYIADVFFDTSWLFSIDRLYNSNHTVNHFVAGMTSMPQNIWWAQNDIFTIFNQCIKSTTLRVKVINTVVPAVIVDPLIPKYSFLNNSSFIPQQYIYDLDNPCPDLNNNRP